MAFVVEQQPVTPSPSGNPLWFVVSSTNSGNLDFQYILEFVVPGLPTTVKIKVPDINGFGTFDAQSLVDATILKITPLFPDFAPAGAQQLANNIEYSVSLGEEFRATPTDPIVEFPGITTVTGLIAFWSTLTYNKFSQNNWIDEWNWSVNFKPGIDLGIRGQTSNMPDFETIQDNENAYLTSFPPDNSGLSINLRIRTYDASGTLTDNLRISLGTPAFSRGILASAGPLNINSYDALGVTVLLGAFPVVWTDISRYEIWVEDAVGDEAITEARTWVLEELCDPFFSSVRVHWLNEVSGYDSYTFDLKSRKNININRTTFRKDTNVTDAFGAIISDPKEGAVNLLETAYSERLIINSRFLTDEQFIWLRELVTSPMVWVEDAEFGFIRFNVTDSNYRLITRRVDRLSNLTVQLESANPNTTQHV